MSELEVPKIYQLPDGQECCIVMWWDEWTVIMSPTYLETDMDYLSETYGENKRTDKLPKKHWKRVAEYTIMKALGYDLKAIKET